MRGSFFCLIFLLNYCYSEQLLGGWSVSSDDSLKSECLEKALVHLNGGDVNNDIRAEASNLVCRTQVVNGLNIKCTFTFRAKKQRCSFYKSFIQTLETQLEQCKDITDEPVVEERDTENNNDNEDEEQQPLIAEEKNDEHEEEQSAPVSESNKENEVVATPDSEEEEDEAAVDSLSQRMSDQAANNDDDEQQPQ